MNEEIARRTVESAGFEIDRIEAIEEGSFHDNFFVTLSDGRETVARFSKEGKDTDPTYGGQLSLEREQDLCEIAQDLGLRSPKVDGPFQAGNQRFLLAQRLPGVTWGKFLENANHSLPTYLSAMENLGRDVAKAHSKRYESFGNIMQEGVISPEGNTNFAKRLQQIVDWKLQRMQGSPAFSETEQRQVLDYLNDGIDTISKIATQRIKPVFLVTDLHPGNILVDEKEDLGWPDLEWCQAGPVEQDMYLIHSLFTAYYDQPTFDVAQEALLRGYRSQGGTYDPKDPLTQQIEGMIRASHTTSAVINYHGRDEDPIRKEWSSGLKELLFTMIESGKVDYVGHSNVFRNKTGQPHQPN